MLDVLDPLCCFETLEPALPAGFCRAPTSLLEALEARGQNERLRNSHESFSLVSASPPLMNSRTILSRSTLPGTSILRGDKQLCVEVAYLLWSSCFRLFHSLDLRLLAKVFEDDLPYTENRPQNIVAKKRVCRRLFAVISHRQRRSQQVALSDGALQCTIRVLRSRHVRE